MNPDLPFDTECFPIAKSIWPSKGKHILATTTSKDTLIVYQAYKANIAKWVVANQTFKECPEFSMDRMTWIKPSFLWMMYRSGWAQKPNQEHILAIQIKESGFKKLLELCKKHGRDGNLVHDDQNQAQHTQLFGSDDVRIQWDPDHDPEGNKLERRAIQLGLRGNALKKFVEEWTVSISDITEFVKRQYLCVKDGDMHLLQVPVQRVYQLDDENIKRHINLDREETGN